MTHLRIVKGCYGGKTAVILQNLSEYKIVCLRYGLEFYHEFHLRHIEVQAIFHRKRTKCLQKISVNVIWPNNGYLFRKSYETSDILCGQNAEVLK